MNRLQKKCAIVTVGIHLLLVVILIVGPGFFAPKPKADDLQVLDVIPANLIDAAFSSGVHDAQPPPPTPIITPPTPPTPTPVVTPAPTRAETPEPAKPIEKALTPEPKPAEKPKIQINTQLVARTAPKNSSKTTPRDDSLEKARTLALAARNAARALKNSFTPAMTIDMPGDSSVSYADYAAIVKSVYWQAWESPANAQNDEANVKVLVTIANDGTVISARIIAPSGDPSVDDSVQRTLDRVTFIAPFPEGAKEKERPYTLNFNLKAKRSSE
ncbi:MAG TPA: TonB family protein [Verrucomicrobiae bacterium]|nr:TonB family protein [Verrucomicrobiae bacterium]